MRKFALYAEGMTIDGVKGEPAPPRMPLESARTTSGAVGTRQYGFLDKRDAARSLPSMHGWPRVRHCAVLICRNICEEAKQQSAD